MARRWTDPCFVAPTPASKLQPAILVLIASPPARRAKRVCKLQSEQRFRTLVYVAVANCSRVTPSLRQSSITVTTLLQHLPCGARQHVPIQSQDNKPAARQATMSTATEQSPINFTPDEGDGSMAPGYAVIFCLNYMMGSGYLTLPRAFADAGLVWGLSILVAVSIGATAAAECLLDCMARAGWIAAARALPESGGSFCRVPLDAPSPPVTRLQREAPRPVQLPDLCALYLGDAGYAAYVTLISGYMLGSLWCYAAIFAAALEANLAPSGHVLYVGLFALFVVPLSLKDLADQKAVQTLLAFGRVVMLAVMLIGVAPQAAALRVDALIDGEDLTVEGRTTVLVEEMTATWCSTCADIDPYLAEVADRHGSRLALVSLHPQDGQDGVATNASEARLDRWRSVHDDLGQTPAFLVEGEPPLVGPEVWPDVTRRMLELESSRSARPDLGFVATRDGSAVHLELTAPEVTEGKRAKLPVNVFTK
mgnify:CR=1 FL=1